MEAAAGGLATEALFRLVVFEGCSRQALIDAARKARLADLPSGCELPLSSEELYVVLEGTALARSGVGPLSALEPGSILNEATLLTGGHGPPLDVARQQAQPGPSSAIIGGVEASCVTNLCPHSPPTGGSPKGGRPTSRGRGQLSVTGGAPRPSSKRSAKVSGEHGGAVLAAISMAQLKDRLSAHGSLQRFNANRERLLERWAALAQSPLLPGASNEFLFALTEVAEHQKVEAGDALFSEGSLDDNIFLVAEGEAEVEKKVFSKASKGIEHVPVGTVSAGAVLGDAAMVCAKVPRCATVRASTSMKLVVLPSKGLLTVLHRFPSATSYLEERIKEVVHLLAEALPPKVDVLSSLRLFAHSDQMFLTAIAGIAERHVYYCGEVLKREGMSDGTLYVVEFGACTVESSTSGVLTAVIQAGSCMGERTLLGAEKANATVKVATPVAMMLTVQQAAFNCTLRRFPWDAQRFQNFQEELQGDAARHHDASSLRIFQGCSQDFVREITGAMAICAFMPGQTVIVQGAADGGQMFAIKGGRVSVEVGGKSCVKLGPGDVFGELAMLGIVRRRASTVRALTFCIMLEIPREAFLAAMDRHPRERQRFEAFAMQHAVAASSVQWPILTGMPSQFLYLVNLYAERRICVAGDTSLSAPPTNEAAVMVMQGSLTVVGADGVELREELVEGECFNVEALLGVPLDRHLHPKSTCEVQILTRAVWDKVLSEFPEHREECRARVLGEMARKAQVLLEREQGGLGVLRHAALFRTVSKEMAQQALGLTELRLLFPGDELAGEGDECMYWLLQGTLQQRRPAPPGEKAPSQFQSGAVFGEAVALGTATGHVCAVEAQAICLVQALSRAHVSQLLAAFPEDAGRLQAVIDEAKNRGGGTLQEQLLQSPFLAGVDRAAALQLCQEAEDVFVAPGEVIFSRGEKCELGQSCVYVMLAGQADVESLGEITMNQVLPGAIFGEMGAFGLREARTTTVRSWSRGLVHCAKLHGWAVREVIRACPAVLDAARQLTDARTNENRAFQERKQEWLQDTVSPALARSPVLAVVSDEAIWEIAAESACIKSFAAGQQIAGAGESADSMLLVLEGSVEVKSQHGKVLGMSGPGALFGEVCLLGLLMLRTATLTASNACQVLAVTKQTVEKVLAEPSAAASKAAFDRMRRERLEQVSRCVPLSALTGLVGCSKDDVSVKVVALQAERLMLPAGSIWQPLPVSDPAGPQYGFLVRGHAVLQNPEEDRPVMTLPDGCVLHEGLVEKYGAHIRAVGASEAYRVAKLDLELASQLSSASGAAWQLSLQALLKDSKRHMATKLGAARGALNGSLPHKADTDIRLWKLEKEMLQNTVVRVKSFTEQAAERQKRQTLKRTAQASLRHGSMPVLGRYQGSATILKSLASGPTSPQRAASLGPLSPSAELGKSASATRLRQEVLMARKAQEAL